MSTHTSASSERAEADVDSREERPTLGSRENYWGGVEEPTADAYDVEGGTERRNHSEHAGIARDRWIASSILRGAPETEILCPECWSELSEPRHYVERSEVELEIEDDAGNVVKTLTEIKYADHRRHRECPSCSEISWGGQLADVETETFLEIVDRVLDAISSKHGLRERRVDELRAAAATRKSAGLSDEANLERLLIDVRVGVSEEL